MVMQIRKPEKILYLASKQKKNQGKELKKTEICRKEVENEQFENKMLKI